MARDKLDSALIDRINARLKDDWRRTGEGDYAHTPAHLRPKHEGGSPFLQALVDAAFASIDREPTPVKPVGEIDEKGIAKVEKSLGFPIPPALRQLSLEVGDGNFGPFNGIRRLANWAKDYLKLRAELPAERGREWPEALLPIVYLNGKRICLDRDSGAILLWTKPPKKASEKKWLASFVPQSDSLGEWLERWVDTPAATEGGPDGGWTPPDSEIERRDAVERDKEAKRLAEIERSRTFTLGTIAPLDEALLARVRAKAMDPDQRTPMARADRAPGGLMSALVAPFGLKFLNTAGPGAVMMRRGTSGKLGAPATARDFDKAEEKLGFALPAPLRQLYAIADGGFGPSSAGFFSLSDLARTYAEKLSRPEGPVGEPWPAKLLPLSDDEGVMDCLDLETGKIVNYDVERMDHEGPGQWRRSFRPEAASLTALLEAWLGSTDMLSDYQREERNAMEGWADEAIAKFEAMSDAARASHGLDGPNWRDEVRRRVGVPPRGD